MAYAIITTCFVRVKYFDSIFNFERELSVILVNGGNWVSESLTVEIEAK